MMSGFIQTSDGAHSEDSESVQLLYKQDVKNAIEFFSSRGIEVSGIGERILAAVGRLRRENRMLENLVRSYESSGERHTVAGYGMRPPFDEVPRYDPPCKSVDEIVGADNVGDNPIPAAPEFNPMAIRKVLTKHRHADDYRKPNAGILR